MTSLTGWKPAECNIDELNTKYKRCIIVYNHSTCMDFSITALYTMLDTEMSKIRNKITIITRIPKSYFLQNLIQSLPINTIGIYKADEKGNGNYLRIVDSLSKREEWALIISPSGHVIKRPWRHSWYYLAKEFNVPIFVAGPDFEKHQMIFLGNHPVYVNGRSYEEVEREVKDLMGEIVPLNLNREEGVITKKHHERSLIPRENTFTYVIILLILVLSLFLPIFLTKEWRKVEYVKKLNTFKPKRNFFG